MNLKTVKIEVPKDTNIILGQSHFIKTVEDIYEAIVSTNPNIKFGLAFAESSGDCYVRHEGNDEHLRKIAAENIFKIGAGHTFMIVLQNGYPINILNAIKNVPEVCRIYAATANPLKVIVAEDDEGCGIVGVIDGYKPKKIEEEKDITWRKEILRKLKYKF